VKHAAIFDLDGTILKGSSETAFAFYILRKGRIGLRELASWVACLMGGADTLGWREAVRVNKMYLRNKPVAEVRELAANCFSEQLVHFMFHEAVAEIGRHKREGRCVVLLSGTPDFILESFGGYLGADIVVGARLETRDGRFTGRLSEPHPFGRVKASIVSRLAQEHAIDLAHSFGYGDSSADAFFLDSLGFPVAVNPDRHLSRYAKRKGWPVLHFEKQARH